MQEEIYSQQIEASLRRLEELWRLSHEPLIPQKESLVDSLEENDRVLEELKVGVEELRAQNQELVANRHAVEVERQRYQELFEFISEAYLVTNAEAVIREANQAAASLLQVSCENLVGKPLVIFIARQSKRNFQINLSQLLQSQEVSEWEFQLQPRERASFPATFRVKVVREYGGQVVELRWLLRDISERQHYEAAVSSIRDALEKQVEERTAELLESNQGLKHEIAKRQLAEEALQQQLLKQSELYQQLQQYKTDLEARVRDRTAQLQQSLEFEAMLKRITDDVRDSLDESQILQTAVWELAVVLNIDGCDTALYDADKTTSTITCEYTVGIPSAQGYVVRMADFWEVYSQLLQGQYFQFCRLVSDFRGPVAMLACPIFDNREVIGDLWLFKPQEDAFNQLEIRLVQQVANQCAIAIRQARLYQAAREQIEELQKLSRLKDDFLSTVSHELRTPISNIKMATQMLAIVLNRDFALSEELNKPTEQQSRVARYFHILQKECEREIRLIDNLLDLQRLYAGAKPLLLTSIHLQDWLPRIVEPFQERIQNRKQSLRVDISPHLPRFMSDPTNLGRILSELLDNACKYTPMGEMIVLTAQVCAGKLQLSVSNSGVEIPAKKLSLIFDKFYRLPSSDPWKEGGTGLGLALVQKLTTLLEGTIRVESSPGQTCFKVEFPINSSGKERGR